MVWMSLLMVLFIIVCLFLVLIVLIQKGRGGGLSSAFGGMGGNTAFGSKTGDVLTWATSIVFGIFLLLAIGLNLMANYQLGPTVDATEPITTPISPEGRQQ
jgi:preprotein translocase subunit SecG